MTNTLRHHKIPQLQNLDKLEEVLTGIWSGKLEHNQNDFFCGTACCVAGWLVVLNTELGKVIPPDKREKYIWKGLRGGEMVPFYNDKESMDAFRTPWTWARQFVGLTNAEAILLFGPTSTKQLQLFTLYALKEGRRFVYTQPIFGEQPEDSFPDYESGRILDSWFDSSEAKKAVLEFLLIED